MTVVEHADALFAQGLDLVRRFRPTQAEPLLRRALDLLEAGGTGEVSAARVMITLAYVEAEQGRLDLGLDLLEQATTRAGGDTAMAGLAQSQRGLLFLRAGRHQEARRALDQALANLGEDPEHRATVHLNRGLLLLTLGITPEAMNDFERCAALAADVGVDDLAALARHNLGYLALLAGDLPRALREMDAAAAAMPHRDDGEHVLLLDRARVLHACGMFEDAEATLERVAGLLNPRTHGQDLGEAELLRAQNCLHLGQADQAQRLAARAARRFSRRGSQTWRDLARLTQLRARAQAGAPVRATEVLDVARRLREQGLREDARLARALAAEVAPQQPVPVAAPTDGVLTRLYVHQVAAEQALRLGDRERALRRARDGLGELQRFQAGVGSLDLQAAVTGHGRRLAGLGLDCALEQGRPATVFTWAERARALASRLAPVTPPQDPDAAALLTSLRLARRRLREATLAGLDDRALRARCAELEREVREGSWRRSGPARVLRAPGLEEVREGLGDDVLVAHLVRPHGCFALVVGPGGASVTHLGATRPLLEEIRRVRADLDALALKGIPAQLRRSVADSLSRGLDGLSHALLDPLPRHARRGRLVLLPSDELLAVPWPLLAGARGRPLTVARSATAWMHAGAARGAAAGTGGPLLVGGPDLDQAEAEIAGVARSWPGAQVLVGADARGEEVLRSMAGRDLVHLAAHGVHESANPLFSALRLADGPLFGYDLARCAPLPRDVVLSACDLGLSTPSSQGERLGMTAALLHGGVRSVVASVARVGDAQAREAMIAHHELLAGGGSPAEALARALTSPSLLTPFVCFGRGW